MPLFDELLVKVAQNETLTPPEMESFRQEARRLADIKNAVESWIPSGSNDPTFREMRSGTGVFGISPIGGMMLQRVGAQSVNDNTETSISWNSRTPNTHILTNTTDATKLNFVTRPEILGVFGTVEWATNGTGRRGVHLNLYDKDDVPITGVTLHSLLPTGIAEDTLPFSGGFYFPPGNANDYSALRFTVVQTSGGALNLNSAKAFLFAIR